MNNLSATEFSTLLKSIKACSEAREWAAGKNLRTVWETCDRADWMLWLVGKMSDKEGWPTRQQVVLTACLCAETALKFGTVGEERPRKAIEAARRWARGEATIQGVREAADAAYAAAYAAYASAAYAAYAAYDAAYAAAYAAASDAASVAISSAYASAAAAAYASAYASAYAYAYAYAYADAAYAAASASARAKALAEMADIVRRELPQLSEGGDQ